MSHHGYKDYLRDVARIGELARRLGRSFSVEGILGLARGEMVAAGGDVSLRLGAHAVAAELPRIHFGDGALDAMVDVLKTELHELRSLPERERRALAVRIDPDCASPSWSDESILGWLVRLKRWKLQHTTHADWGDGLPANPSYLHVIRAPDDPERMPKAERAKLGGNTADKWRADLGSGEREWADRIVALLSDGCPRTFNRIVLELTAGEYTADVAFGKAPDQGLWLAVEQGRLEWTKDAPVLFRAWLFSTHEVDRPGWGATPSSGSPSRSPRRARA